MGYIEINADGCEAVQCKILVRSCFGCKERQVFVAKKKQG
jgi:hypothetical protein